VSLTSRFSGALLPKGNRTREKGGANQRSDNSAVRSWASASVREVKCVFWNSLDLDVELDLHALLSLYCRGNYSRS